jgi:GxxExxY protein
LNHESPYLLPNLPQESLGFFYRRGAEDAEGFIVEVSRRIIGAAIEVHKVLGPGLLENVYEECLAREFQAAGLHYERQLELPAKYKGALLDCGYRLDFLVENTVVVEIKSVSLLQPIHEAQMLTYLKLGGWDLGLLMNFNVPVLKDGVRRVVLNYPDTPSASSASLR